MLGYAHLCLAKDHVQQSKAYILIADHINSLTESRGEACRLFQHLDSV